MNILGLDTSFLSDTSIGFYFSPEEQLEINLKIPLSQEEKLMAAIDAGFSLLRKQIQNIDCIAVGVGPGSFTGIRIGLSTAKGLAWSLGIKMVGLSSLDLLANEVRAGDLPEMLVVPVMDARMNKVFTAIYQTGARISPEMDIAPHSLAELLQKRPEHHILFLGDGFKKHAAMFESIPGKTVQYGPQTSIKGLSICHKALDMIAQGPSLLQDPHSILPTYLRKSEAEEMASKQS